MIPPHNQELGNCWEWTGALYKSGYGFMGVGNKSGKRTTEGAHRVSYKIHTGKIPIGFYICHHCDNKTCVRPSHLFLGTPKENSKDRDLKFRGKPGYVPGEKNGMSKLSENDVLKIRSIGKKLKQKEIALQFNVTQTLIGMILRRKIWKNI